MIRTIFLTPLLLVVFTIFIGCKEDTNNNNKQNDVISGDSYSDVKSDSGNIEKNDTNFQEIEEGKVEDSFEASLNGDETKDQENPEITDVEDTGSDIQQDTGGKDVIEDKIEESDEVCVPNCEGKECGDDGCGGSCGECTTGICNNGKCVTQTGDCYLKTLNINGDDKGVSFYELEDGNLIIAGNTKKPNDDKGDAFVGVVNSTFTEFEWKKTYGGDGFDTMRRFVKGDNSYLIVGYSDSQESGNFDGWLVKIDSSGNEVFNKTFGGNGWDQFYDAIFLEDGSILAVGFTASKGAGGFDVWVVKISSSGEMLWDKTFGGQNDDEGHAVVKTFDGKFLVVGMSIPDLTNWVDLKVIKIDGNGDLIWEKNYGGTEFDEGYDVVRGATSGFVITGYTQSYSQNQDADIWIVRIDDDGNLLWDKKIGDEFDDKGYRVTISADHSFLVGALKSMVDPLSDQGSITLIKIKDDGTVVWEQSFEDTWKEYLGNIRELKNGGIGVIGGSPSFNDSSDAIFFMKLNSNGELCE